MLSKIQTLSAEKHNLMGLDELYNKKQFVKAIAYFSRALFANNKEPSYYWHRAEAYFEISDFESYFLNLRLFQESIKNQTLDPDRKFSVYINVKRYSLVLYTWAQILLDQKRYAESIEIFKQTLDYGFTFSDIAPRLAIACIGLNNLDEAIAHLFQLTNTDKVEYQDIEIYLLRARLYFIQGKSFHAAADLKIASQLNPKHKALHSLTIKILEAANDLKNKASAQIIKKDFNLAITFLSQAIELDPEDYKTLMQRGIVRGLLGQLNEGLDDLLEVYTWPTRNGDHEKQLCIEIAKLHEKIAMELFEDESKHDKAFERFELSLNFNPDNPSAYYSRAKCYLKMGNHEDDALKDLMTVYNFDPKKSPFDSPKEFKTVLEKAKEKISSIYTQRAKKHIIKGMALPLLAESSRTEEYSTAIGYLTDAIYYHVDLNPSHLLFERARCYFYLQNLEAMKQDIEDCLDYNPNHVVSRALLSLYDMKPYPSKPFPKREAPTSNTIHQILDLYSARADKKKSGKEGEQNDMAVTGRSIRENLEINLDKVDKLFKTAAVRII